VSDFIVNAALEAYGDRMNNENKDPLDLSVIDLKHPEERRRFLAALQEEGGHRAKEAVEKLQALGILDQNGRVIPTELPEDMRPNAERDFGG
jgi:hypothetical protein